MYALQHYISLPFRIPQSPYIQCSDTFCTASSTLTGCAAPFPSTPNTSNVGLVGLVGENGSDTVAPSSVPAVLLTASATASESLSRGCEPVLTPLSTESVCACVCALPRPQRRVLGGAGFWPCLVIVVPVLRPGVVPRVGLDITEAGMGRWWLVDGVVPVERRGGGRAGAGFEAERRACPGTGGPR